MRTAICRTTVKAVDTRLWRFGSCWIRPGGPGLIIQHNFKTAFYTSTIADNNSFEQWEAEGARDANQRAERARKLLQQYEAPPLDPAPDEALLDFIARRKQSLPDAVR